MRLRRASGKTAAPARRRSEVVRQRRVGRTVGLAAAVVAVAGTIAAGWWAYGQRPWVAAEDGLRSALLDATAAAGLTVRQVYLVGRDKAPLKPLQEAVGAEPGMPILAFDPYAAREALLALPWVADAEVERRLPDHIVVQIRERIPMALWQRSDGYAVIDRAGVPIPTARPQAFHDLPLVVGEGAPERAAALLDALALEPDLATRVQAAILVSRRRWNLLLRNGTEIRLPEQGVGDAWARLARAVHDQGLLDRDVMMVDLRLPDRLIVRSTQPLAPIPGAAKNGRST